MRKARISLIMALIITAAYSFPTGIGANVIVRTTVLPEAFEIGKASYYSYECASLPMANGEPFDPERRTCASWFYKLGTVLHVQSLDTGKVTRVIVTDRGPNRRLVRRGRVIDLSRRAFEDICELEKGLTRVVISVEPRRTP